MQNRDGGWNGVYLSQTSSRPFCLFKWVQMPAADSCLMEVSDNGRQRSREMSGRLGGWGRETRVPRDPKLPWGLHRFQSASCTQLALLVLLQPPSWCRELGPYGEAIPPTHTWKSHTHTRMCNRIVWASAIYMWQHCKHTVLRQRFNSLSIKHTESVSVCSTLNLLY